MNRYEDLRAGVLARGGRNGSKSVSRLLRRISVDQLRLEISRPDRNLTSHFSAPQGGESFGIGSPFSAPISARFRPWFTRLARVLFMGTGAFGTRQRGNSCV
jgi:hypothetical protein